MHILYLHQHFATRSGAGGTRSYEFAKWLLRNGHTVTMVVANRQAGGIENKPRQTIDGIEVLSMGGWYSNYQRPWRRMFEFFRFTLKASLLGKKDLTSRPDVVVATSTPLTIGIPGRILARRFGTPFVFEVRDLWPQAPIELGLLRNPAAKKVARWLERWCYRHADRIIALSPGMERGIIEQGTPAAKVDVIPNASDTDLFSPAHRNRQLLDEWGISDRFVAVHGGSMGEANGLDAIIDTARILQQRADGNNIHFLLCGYGGTRPRLEKKVKDWGLTNVTFAGSIAREKLGAIVSSCDVAVTSFANFPVLATNSPNKMFDALAAGLPVIVNSDGWTRELIESSSAGLYVDVTNPESLADALERLRADDSLREKLGRNARVLAEKRFDRSLLAQQFETAIRKSFGNEELAPPSVKSGAEELTRAEDKAPSI